MADQSNSKSPFSFPEAGKGLFGSQAPNATTTGAFTGSSAPVTASTGGGLFGAPTKQSNSAPTSGVFGGGGRGNQPAAGGGTSFGQFSIGGSISAAHAGQPANVGPSGSIFSTPNKPADAGTTSKSVFGASSGGSGIFGSKTSSEDNTTTPTSKPTNNLFGNSTTPAGPPPGASTGTGSVPLFSFSKPESKSGASSGVSEASSTKTSTPSLFPSLGGLSTDSNKSQVSQAPSQASNVFGQGPNSSTNNFGGNQKGQAHSAPSLNSNDNKSSSGLFSNIGRTTTSSSASAPSILSGGGIFGKSTASNTNTGITSTAAISDGQKTSAGNPLGNLTSTVPTSSSTVGAPATSSSSLFGSLGKAAAPSSIPESQAPPAMATADTSKSSATNLGASTSGPAPLARSRLKDKTMDDIIARWASDLSKYQKDFQTQAEKVASWDRILVENSEKIQRLYGSTLEAERATTEVERQLTSVENDQAELESWLNHYEAEVDNMIQNQVGKSDGLSGPDQERERTYQLATRLSDRLDDMSKDLSSMIEEINDASSNLSKHSKSDDPLTQVVRVLNNHLTQLQQIDQGAARLQLKVKEAQRVGQSIRPSNGLNGPSSDAAEAFYRSFMGR